MRNFLLVILAGMMLLPTVAEAKVYKTKDRIETDEIPIRTPASTFVSVNLNETTGILTLYCVGNVGTMQVTISQNGVDIDDDYMAVSNGQSVVYDLSGYAVGEYLLTIELGNGTTKQYIISIEDD